MKTCTKCHQTKPQTEFYAHAAGKRPGLVSARCKACEAERMKAYYAKNKASKKVWFGARYARLKGDVFRAYGGYVCACCGETEPAFLTIDHVDDNGSDHRRALSPQGDYRSASGYKTYRWLERNGFPPGYRVLCSNCNHGRFRNGGICPHQQRPEGSTTIPKGSTPQAIGGGSAEPLAQPG